MSPSFCEEDLIADFDARFKKGLIFYQDNPAIQTQTIDGFKYEFTVTGAIGKKPFIKDNADGPQQQPPSSSTSAAPEGRSPGYAPGSDIDVSGYEITRVNGASHLLMFNKYCMYRLHMLLVTSDGWRRQFQQLDLDDFGAAWQVMATLNWRYFMFFNCGKDGGCSRLHKHVQIVPYLEDRLGPWPETCTEPPNPPYEYVLRRFEDSIGAEGVLGIYEQAMVDLKSRFGPNSENSSDNAGASDDHIPHNVALGRNWIIVIPRRAAGVRGAYGNTLSMLGMVSVATEDELRCWLSQGPREVQSQLGIPRGSSSTTAPNGARTIATTQTPLTENHLTSPSPPRDRLSSTQQGLQV